MMKNILLAGKLIWKHKFLNLLLLITMTASLNYLAPTISQVQHYQATVDALDHLDMEHGYYLYMNMYGRKDQSIRDSVQERSEGSDYTTGMAELFHLVDEESSFNIMVYNETLISRYLPVMKAGVWLKDCADSEYLPVVVTADTGCKTGQIIPLSLSKETDRMEVLGEVVGVLDSSMLPEFSGAADDDYFTADALISHIDTAIILPLTADIEAFIDTDAYMWQSAGSILYTDGSTSYEGVVDDFGYAGIVTDLWAGHNRFYEVSRVVTAATGAYFLVYFLISVICLLCSSVILGISSQKTFTIYYLTGMSAAQRNYIEVIRIAILIIIGTGVSYWALHRMGVISMFFEETHKLVILVGIMCYMCLIYLPVSAGFMRWAKKEQIIDSVRNLNIGI